jgi:glycosyltransferase involved in cell wall biosynthesis
MPKISVVMSVYNGEKYLRPAVESILSQTFGDFEFIIVNDGSTDNSESILREYQSQDKRIRLVSRENQGLIYSLNEGIGLALGDYIARMDADDISMPERLEKQLKYIQENNLVIGGTWAEVIDDQGKKVKEFDYPPGEDQIKNFTLLHNPFIHPTVMFQKNVFGQVGGYRKSFKHVEDYELWTRIVFKYRAGNLPERLLQYRLHEKQITKANHLEMRVRGILVRLLALFRFVFRF